MTFREKLKKEHPEYVSSLFDGGCFWCPVGHGYEDAVPNECEEGKIECEECWNREMPEEDTPC